MNRPNQKNCKAQKSSHFSHFTFVIFLISSFIGNFTQAASIPPIVIQMEVGDITTIDRTLSITKEDITATKLDVFFLTDATTSMGQVISGVKASASAILAAINDEDSRFEGLDIGFGAGFYLGDPIENNGESLLSPYTLIQPIHSSSKLTLEAIENWSLFTGGDIPEGNFFALHQVATQGADIGVTPGTGLETGWREDAKQVIVWFGDEVSHTATITEDSVIEALQQSNITVVAINAESPNSGIDRNNQASRITSSTNGSLENSVHGSADPVIDVILKAVEGTTIPIDLTFSTNPQILDGLSIKFDCKPSESCVDIRADASLSFSMEIEGLSEGRYEFQTIFPELPQLVSNDVITVIDNSCKLELTIPNNQWQLISLPCNPGEKNTVSEIFGDSFSDPAINYGIDWVVQRYDTDENIYIRVPLDAGQLKQGEGYWIIQLTGKDILLSMENKGSRTPVLADCPLSSGCFPIKLASRTNAVQPQFFGYPFEKSLPISELKLSFIGSDQQCKEVSYCDLSEARSFDIFRPRFIGFFNGSFQAINNESKLDPWRGYWAMTLKNAAERHPVLLIPQNVDDTNPPRQEFEPKMVKIPSGTFNMGSPKNEPGRNNNEQLHSVAVSEFFIGKYEVTFSEYDYYIEATGAEEPRLGSSNDRGSQRPVSGINWQDATQYAEWLSEKTGKNYRLPTEAEWEYAARASSSTLFHFGENIKELCQYGNTQDLEYQNRTGFGTDISPCNDGYYRNSPVGRFLPNKFGLYDTLGNVAEWTCSKSSAIYNGTEKSCAEKNANISHNNQRVLRGGTWSDSIQLQRVSSRRFSSPLITIGNVGFRLAQDP